MDGRQWLNDVTERYRRYKRRMEDAAERVDDTQFFATAGGNPNSIAVLMKHVGGNLRSRWRDFLSTDGEKRDRLRDSEFEIDGETRASVLEHWRRGWDVAFAELEALRPDDLDRTVTVRGAPMSVVQAMHRNLEHVVYHAGQIVGLARSFLGDAWRTQSIARGESDAHNEAMRERHGDWWAKEDDAAPHGIDTRPLTPERWADFVAVLGPDGCDGCWCFNHHITPGDADVRGDAACAAKEQTVRAGGATGILGYVDGRPTGWCALDRRRDIPGHDCVTRTEGTDGDVWALHCFFVRPEARGRGLARAMLRAALDWLRSNGADSVEAFPSPPGGEAFFNGFGGPFALYAQEGFAKTDDIDENFCRVALDLRN